MIKLEKRMGIQGTPDTRVSRRPKVPVALTIAGSDSGGGAGIQADLKTFAALGVHGTSAITCITAQNPRAVFAIQPCKPAMVLRQMEAVFEGFPVAAVKTGMLFSESIIRVICRFFRQERSGRRRVPLVVDPVMVATSGAKLLKSSAMTALSELLPLASLVTPNLDEATILSGIRIEQEEDLRIAARSIFNRWHCAVLVKGGHLRGLREAIDLFYDGRTELLLKAPRVPNVSTHGTGCTCSAAIAGYLALGSDLPYAVEMGKKFISQAIARGVYAGSHPVLNSFGK
jgi:hydroxymethylpyrimidine/phosphomethylpyrimidine kinase